MTNRRLLEVLRGQHARIADLASAVWDADAGGRRAATRRLIGHLARQRAAEQVFVHAVGLVEADAADVVRRRVSEEQEISEAVARVEQLDTGSVDFMIQFGLLEEAVLAHHTAEEAEVPSLTEALAPAQQARMADAMELVDTLPPLPERGGFDELTHRAHAQLAALSRNL